MCGRYLLDVPGGQLASQLGVEDRTGDFQPTWNAAPTVDLPVLGYNPREQRESLALMTWGLVPSWAAGKPEAPKPQINARAETVIDKPSFRTAFAKRRCLVPASGFYEWCRESDGRKTPHLIRMKGGEVATLAGIYDVVKQPDGSWRRGFAILTTAANDLVAPLHNRMPVFIAPEDREAWLHMPEADAPVALAPLLRALDPAQMEEWAVSTAVNNVRNDGPELALPAA
jgi:putative SOS response-associated peptidase YedK